MAEVESLTKALEGAAVEKQGFSEALALKRQRVGTLERQVASLLGKMAAAREEVNICILHNIRSARTSDQNLFLLCRCPKFCI